MNRPGEIDIRQTQDTPTVSIIFGDGEVEGSRAASIDVGGYNYISGSCCNLRDAEGDTTSKIFYKDITNLIKALQAALDLHVND